MCEYVGILSDKGAKKYIKPEQLSTLDPQALLELGKVGAYGTEKYGRYNFIKGYPYSYSLDAAFRHLLEIVDGETTDPESGLLHAAHAMWHCMMLISMQLRCTGIDDTLGGEEHGK